MEAVNGGETVTGRVLAEILGGDGIGLRAAARSLPSTRQSATGHVDPATVWRWVTLGCPALAGGTVHLEAVRIGASWMTSRAALARFVSALTPDAPAPVQPPEVPRSLAKRTRAAAAAAKRLEAIGA